MADTFDRSLSFEQPLAKRVHVADSAAITTNTTERVAFGADGQRVRSFQEEAAVPSELRSRLETIGMRTRFNVNRGYGVPPPSMVNAAGFNGLATSSTGLVTEREILHHVRSNRAAFARTQSAPLYAHELQPFGGSGLRPILPQSLDAMIDENEDPLAAAFFDEDEDEGQSSSNGFDGPATNLKRSRDEQEEDDDPLPAANPSFVRQAGAPPFGASRMAANTLPVSAGLSSYLAGNSIFPTSEASQHPDEWTQQNLAAFTRSDDF